MKLLITLIRHGGISCADRFIGMTDEPLDEEGRRALARILAEKPFPKASLVFTSGLSRCVETAKLLYPDVPAALLHELRAPHYGIFEGKNRADLSGDAEFMKWMDSPRIEAFPGGEALYDVAARSALAFRKICSEMADKGIEQVATVSHGFVLEAILRRYCIPRAYYIESKIAHGGGVFLQYDTEAQAAVIVDRF